MTLARLNRTRLYHGTLHHDRRGATALEFALVFPTFLTFIFGFFTVYSMTSAKRAMDFGVERALRYVAANGGASASAVLTAYCNGASTINGDVGSTTNCSASALTITPSSFSAGTWVTISSTYTWVPPTGSGTGPVPQFLTSSMTSSGQIRVVH